VIASVPPLAITVVDTAPRPPSMPPELTVSELELPSDPSTNSVPPFTVVAPV
jgi:hypothetical protein